MRTHQRRRTGLLVSAAACGALLTGCASFTENSAAPAAPSIVAAASDSPVELTDLSAGLLPATAFGDGATVTALSLAELRSQLQQALGAISPGDVTITPDSCTAALAALPQPGPDALDGAAAQLARVGGTMTLQGIAAGSGASGAVGLVTGVLGDCASVTVTAAGVGTATIDSTPLVVPEIGDGAAAASVTVTATDASGAARTVTALVGAVQDGDRVVGLASGSLLGTLDEPAFLALLQQAYDAQAAALD